MISLLITPADVITTVPLRQMTADAKLPLCPRAEAINKYTVTPLPYPTRRLASCCAREVKGTLFGMAGSEGVTVYLFARMFFCMRALNARWLIKYMSLT